MSIVLMIGLDGKSVYHQSFIFSDKWPSVPIHQVDIKTRIMMLFHRIIEDLDLFCGITGKFQGKSPGFSLWGPRISVQNFMPTVSVWSFSLDLILETFRIRSSEWGRIHFCKLKYWVNQPNFNPISLFLWVSLLAEYGSIEWPSVVDELGFLHPELLSCRGAIGRL